MSVQFGRCSWERQSPNPEYIERVTATLAPFGPDSSEAYSKDGLNIIFRAFHTTGESRRETQPYISVSGAVVTWDGRLDNREDLVNDLRGALASNSTDLAIVTAAFDAWGTSCFAKLIGDWALSIWNPSTRSLILAKDHIGVRHLYYSIGKNEITWSTVLDPLVLFAGKTFSICDEYIAGWLSGYHPAASLTPYVGIHSVPPSSFVVLKASSHVVSEYWDFNASRRIRYRSDAEYEENLRAVFARAVQRRIRSDRPVLAHLSGGMDSSSIVCMADCIARLSNETPRLDTISWYDDSNPGLNERPFFTKVEEKRGRAGFHIDLGALGKRERAQGKFLPTFESHHFLATPYSGNSHVDFFKLYATYIASQGYRVTLSGVAGDDVMGGGVPTPRPELQNLMARARFFRLAHQVHDWAAKMRKSRISLLWEAAQGFFTSSSAGLGFSRLQLAPWLHLSFVRRNWAPLHGYPSRVRLFGALPSFQNHIATLKVLRRIAAFIVSRPDSLCETRYPYLDRCLMEYMYAIPREQIVRLGQRRSLMKRALVGIVPAEILSKRQKGLAVAEPGETEYPSLGEINEYIVSIFGIVDSNKLTEALQKARHKEEVQAPNLVRALALEAWLRHVETRGVLAIFGARRTPVVSLRTERNLEHPFKPRSAS
jgi:asparagine synthase (glutamine-hydrolysing)